MTDTAAIRARHVRKSHLMDNGSPHVCCSEDTFDWPCDTAVVLASLEEAIKRAEAALVCHEAWSGSPWATDA